MLRAHFLQQWFSLSDPAMEEAFFDTPLDREFARLTEFSRMLEESTILRLRHQLEKNAAVQDAVCAVELVDGPAPVDGSARMRAPESSQTALNKAKISQCHLKDGAEKPD